MISRKSALAAWGVLAVTVAPCAGEGDRDYEPQGGLPDHILPTLSPAWSPGEALVSFDLAEGFQIELVASEPLIEDPVAIDFDAHGRIWVVEMRGFMRDIDATGQFDPVGRVAVLEDSDGDGRMDRRTTYLDGLVLPRALRLYQGGVLVAENDRLWFTRDTDGDFRSDEKVLVDPEYATTGSVEHRANGLCIGMDNWIYSAKSEKRYRLEHGKWKTERTESRGQWGLTHDDWGRFYCNFNWSQLHADLAPPNALTQNPNFTPTLSVNAAITRDQRVYPIRMNTAVNRGYRSGVLDATGKLREFASACAPCIYRGDLFPEEFRGNAFVCAPAANTIKRNLVEDSGLAVSARNGYPDRDFLASTDERFRPVALSGGPDGALYVVDMYRGIIQQAEFMTTFLRRECESRDLAAPVHWGRIYRIVPQKAAVPPAPSLAPENLVALLSHANGWVRDRAQQALVHLKPESAAPKLEALAAGDHPVHAIHALWALDGMGAARFEPVSKAAQSAHPRVAAAALRIAAGLAKEDAARTDALVAIVARTHTAGLEHAFHGVIALGALRSERSDRLLFQLAAAYASDPLMREAILSSAGGRERSLLEWALASPEWKSNEDGRSLLLRALAGSFARNGDAASVQAGLQWAAKEDWRAREILEGTVLALMERDRPLALPRDPNLPDTRLFALLSWPGHQPAPEKTASRPLSPSERAQFVRGQAIYAGLCASCHGPDGGGLTPIAPPLRGSEWIAGSWENLARILLHGVEGPISVKGRKYEAPDVLPAMPPVGMMPDSAIAAVATYLRRAWGHAADPVSPKQVQMIRDLNHGREKAWTAEELLETESASPGP